MAYRSAAFLMLMLLSACDAWPTTVDNRSANTIQFRWHHRDYADWSAPLDLTSGKAMLLARSHYAEDFTGVRIKEGRVIYALTRESIERLHRICSRGAIERRMNLGGDCWLTYHGKGWVSVSRRAPPDITYETISNET